MGKNYTLYLRHPKFDSEPNKSGLVSDLLDAHYSRDASSKKEIVPIMVPADQFEKITAEQPSAVGAEKPCCKKSAPCQHWQWDGVAEVWKNSLSGRTRANEQ